MRRKNEGATILGTILVVLIFILVAVAITAATLYYIQASRGMREATESASEKNKEKLAVYLLPDKKSLLIKNVGQTQNPAKIVALIAIEYPEGPVIHTQQVSIDLPLLETTTAIFENFNLTDQNMAGVVTSLGNLFYASPAEFFVFDAEGLPHSKEKVLTIIFNDQPDNNKTCAAEDLPVIFSPYEASSYTFTWENPLIIESTTYKYRGTVGIVTLSETETTGRITSEEARGVVKAIYARELQVAFRVEGVPETDETILTVENETYSPRDLPQTFTWYSNDHYSFEWNSSLSVGNGKYAWIKTSGLTTARSGLIVPTNNGEVVGYYAHLYNVTFSLANPEIFPSELNSALILRVDDQYYRLDEFSVTLEQVEGTLHTFAWMSPIDLNYTHSIIWESSDGLPGRTGEFTVNSSLSTNATYVPAVRITYDVGGLASDVEDTPVLTLGETTYNVSQLPVTLLQKLGSSSSYEWLTPLSSTNTLKQYRWQKTAGLVENRSGTINIQEPGFMAGFYAAHFLPFAQLSATDINIYVSDAQNVKHAYDLITTELTCSAVNGTPPYNYKWFINEAEVSVHTPYFAFSSNSSGTFNVKCTVTDNENYNYTTEQVEITVQDKQLTATVYLPPEQFYVANATGNHLYSYINTETPLVCIASGGTPPYSYAWFKNGSLESQTFQYGFSTADEGVYEVWCEVTDYTGAKTNSTSFFIQTFTPKYLLAGPSASGEAKLVITATNETRNVAQLIFEQAAFTRWLGRYLLVASSQPPAIKSIDLFTGEEDTLNLDPSSTLLNLLIQQDKIVAVLFDNTQFTVTLQHITLNPLQAHAFYTKTQVIAYAAFADYSKIYLAASNPNLVLISVDENGGSTQFPLQIPFSNVASTTEGIYFASWRLYYVDSLTFETLNSRVLGLFQYYIIKHNDFLYLASQTSTNYTLSKLQPITLNIEKQNTFTDMWIGKVTSAGDSVYLLMENIFSHNLYLVTFNATDLAETSRLLLQNQPPTSNLLVLPEFPQSLITYTVTFNVENVANDTDAIVLTVNGTDYTIKDLPQTFKWRGGTPLSFDWKTPLVAENKRYVWNATRGLSTRQSETINVTQDGNVTAVYSVEYEVTFTAAGAQGTTTILTVGEEEYTPTQLPIHVYVQENAQLTFNWTGMIQIGSDERCVWVNATGLSDKQSDTITVTVGGYVNATYKTQYRLFISVSPEEGGTVDLGVGEHYYDAGETVNVTAIPNANYDFSHWVVNGENSTDNPLQLSMTCGYSLEAVFTYTGTGQAVSEFLSFQVEVMVKEDEASENS